MRPRDKTARRSRARTIGVALVVTGLLLLAASATYYVYGIKARSDLGDLRVDVGQSPTPEVVAPPRVDTSPIAADIPTPARSPEEELETPTQGFAPIDLSTVPSTGLPLPSRILIPAIGVDAETKELAILDLGDSRAYETPDNVVGHIPGTASPGERGNGWYFGHLESPLKGEGNVFGRLPEIPDLLCPNKARNSACLGGVPVYVILQGGDRQYLYRITRTDVVKPDDLRIASGDDAPVITLVTCVPRFYYDHRLLVTAELVGVKQAPSP